MWGLVERIAWYYKHEGHAFEEFVYGGNINESKFNKYTEYIYLLRAT